MTATYIGSLSLGVAVPGAEAAAVAGIAGINGALPDIEARIAALEAFAPLPVDFGAQLLLAQQTVISIQSALTLGLPVPSIDDQIALVAAQLAALLATANAVHAQLSIVTGIKSLLEASGAFAYSVTNTVGGVGSDLSSVLAGGVPGGSPGDACHALLLLAVSPATWDAMSSLFKVTP
jgi:hypothetical protein